MKPQSRDAMKLIRSMAQSRPETIRETSDWEAYEAEKRHSSGWVPSPDEIIVARDKIRAEREESVETPESIRAFLDVDETEETNYAK